MRTALALCRTDGAGVRQHGTGHPTAQVEVRFEHPENFRDASLDSQVMSVAPTW
jgi:hypothetical protein